LNAKYQIITSEDYKRKKSSKSNINKFIENDETFIGEALYFFKYNSKVYAVVDIYKTSQKIYIINTQNVGNSFKDVEILGGFANYYSYIEKEKEETRIIKCDLIENTCIQINIKEDEKYLIDYVSYSEHD
jgi:hypothetical protein